IIGHMGLFFYNQKGSIISIEDLPTTEIIEPKSLPTRSRAKSSRYQSR
ncbi:AraC family transcriptional regulator, partial [Streptococcus thermophilus]|nr:AraC family transcriptional regulator [Streptococcus thermophilus]